MWIVNRKECDVTLSAAESHRTYVDRTLALHLRQVFAASAITNMALRLSECRVDDMDLVITYSLSVDTCVSKDCLSNKELLWWCIRALSSLKCFGLKVHASAILSMCISIEQFWLSNNVD